MNITTARKIRRANRFGYFAISATEMVERCPQCHQDVTTFCVAWANHTQRAHQRDDAMIEHLMDEHS